MSSRTAGLTRAELTVAFAIVALTAAVAVPSALSNRIAANEASAVASLREIAAAQEKFKAAVYCDVDHDGVGEYGLLRELTGAVGVRTDDVAGTIGAVLDPPLLSRAGWTLARNPYSGGLNTMRAGYLFLMFLPGSRGEGVGEVPDGAVTAAISRDRAEATWCCYAWPERYSRTGERTFFVNQTGDLVATDSSTNDGAGRFSASNAGAAFQQGGPLTDIAGAVAIGTRGRDNNFWSSVPTRSFDLDQRVAGRLTSTDAVHRSGTFAIDVHQAPTQTRETLVVRVVGARGAMQLVLVDASGARSADFGALPSPRSTTFRFDSAARLLPDGVSTLADFSGGTIEVRVDGVAVATGRIPAFATPAGPADVGATTTYFAAVPLAPPDAAASASGALTIDLSNGARGKRQILRVDAQGLDVALFPYSLLAYDPAHPDDGFVLGDLVRRGRDGAGTFALVARRPDELPFRADASVSGMTIEIRTQDDVVVLAGAFPTIQ